jgi:hypothetical protein
VAVSLDKPALVVHAAKLAQRQAQLLDRTGLLQRLLAQIEQAAPGSARRPPQMT